MSEPAWRTPSQSNPSGNCVSVAVVDAREAGIARALAALLATLDARFPPDRLYRMY